MKVYIYCFLYFMQTLFKRYAKLILRREPITKKYFFLSFRKVDFDKRHLLKNFENAKLEYLNDIKMNQDISMDMVFPVENISRYNELKKYYQLSYKKRRIFKATYCQNINEASKVWLDFLSDSKIPSGYKYSGLSYAGYIGEYQEWCLPSWLWINAAIVRNFCTDEHIDKALEIGEIILKYQLNIGGWIVRNDYGQKYIKPLIAPNDSAYIANNACLSLYKATRIGKYLQSAIKCADWIIETSRPDGLVYFGYDKFCKKWETNHNIVDIGFTAGLFAELYSITKEEKYYKFLYSFSHTYINLFYDNNKKRFWSAIDINDAPRGIGFARGQAWALEGLIPAYLILMDKKIEMIINNTIITLIHNQNLDGSWPRELDKPGLGSDSKGTPVIASALYMWMKNCKLTKELQELMLVSIKKALSWCASHTVKSGCGRGGIFSFCYEGAIVHHPYTSTAFVYSSAYALELSKKVLKNQ